MEHFWMFCASLILFCFGHNLAWAENKKEYFAVGRSIEVRPPPGTAAITNVLWKHNDDLVAEWAEGDADVEYYATFLGRTVLNTTTGLLVISSSTEEDAGVYTVEINNVLLEDKYEFTSVQEVPNPSVWAKPGQEEDELSVSCDGDVGRAGPVEFWWDMADDWVKLDRKITVKKNKTTTGMKWLTCKMVNPAGEKESEPVPNPFYEEPRDLSGLAALVLIPVLLGVLGLGYWKRDEIKKRFCPESPVTPASPVEKEELNPPPQP